jgi:thiol-disulfide isomerase/thioredoxin
MRRTLAVAASALALAVTAACSHPAAPTYDEDKSLTVAAPDLVALKKHSHVPDCPRVDPRPAPGGMPSVTVPCLGGGRAVDMAGLRGPMIVNFWASWCGACRDEMPALAAYARNQSAVKVVGVDFLDSQPGAALGLATRSKVAYPLVADPKGALDRAKPLPHISAMPMTVFLDAHGAIAHVEAAAYTSEAEVAAAAQKYLGAGG